MTYTPDPAIVRELAAEAVLDAAREIDFMGVGEQFEDHEAFQGLSPEDFTALQTAIHRAATRATVSVEFGDERED